MGGGNGCLAAPCFFLSSRRRRRKKARLVLWGGESRAAKHGELAGQVMVDVSSGTGTGTGTATVVVCRADAFYLGRPAPVLAIEDALAGGATYLVLPVDRVPHAHDALTAASLAALSYDRWHGGGGSGSAASPSIAGGARSPFEYVKGGDGRTAIKVTPEFLIASITATAAAKGEGGGGEGEACAGALCSTPELRKHYEQLVGAARDRAAWSPRLDTIKERGKRRKGLDDLAAAVRVSPGRLSPVAIGRLLGLVDGGKAETTTYSR